MNNREYLIQILLKLRSTGIKNDGVLKAIEKLPPHYYLSLFKEEKVSIDINIKELIEITKIIETILIHNNKSENILLYGFHSGWSLVLLKNFCKRIYGISRSKKQKKKIEDLLFRKSYNNIFLNTGTDILCWKKVAPFDIILSYDINSFILNVIFHGDK